MAMIPPTSNAPNVRAISTGMVHLGERKRGGRLVVEEGEN